MLNSILIFGNIAVLIVLMYFSNKTLYLKREYIDIIDKINRTEHDIMIYKSEFAYINSNKIILEVGNMYLPDWSPLTSKQIMYC